MASGRYWNDAMAAREISDWRSRGLSMSAYARRQGLCAARLYRWRRRVEGQAAAGPAQFRPVRVRVPADFDGEALRRLVGALVRC